MGEIARDSAEDSTVADGFEGRDQDLDGYTVGFKSYGAHTDLAPLFAGLPDDSCQCRHWGVVLRGRLRYHYTDGTTDDFRAGQAYHARAGHTPELFPDTEVVEFSPTDELARTMEVVTRNMEAAD
jgi:hypothetical protein